MPNARPATASDEAFKQAICLFGDEIERLEQARWRLIALFTRNRGDVTAALGLLHTFQMLGQRKEAIDLAEELWGRRAILAGHERHTLATLQIALGQFDRALELMWATSEHKGVSNQQRRDIVQEIWLLTRDPNVIAAADKPRSDVVLVLDEELEAAQLSPVMCDRQTLVNGIIVPHQCASAVIFGRDGDGQMMLTRISYTTGDYKFRRDLSDTLADKLADFYLERHIDESQASDLLSEVILPVSAQTSGDQMTSEAAA